MFFYFFDNSPDYFIKKPPPEKRRQAFHRDQRILGTTRGGLDRHTPPQGAQMEMNQEQAGLPIPVSKGTVPYLSGWMRGLSGVSTMRVLVPRDFFSASRPRWNEKNSGALENAPA